MKKVSLLSIFLMGLVFVQAQTLKPGIKEADRVIKGVTDYDLPVELQNQSAQKTSGKLKFVVRTDFLDTLAVSVTPVKLAAKSKSIRSIQLKGLKPGIYKVTATYSSLTASDTINFNFALDPEKMTTVDDTPADFVQYWARAKRELAAVDPQYKLIKVDSLATKARDCFLVEMRSLGNVLVRGWLLTPKKPGKYPAVLTVQGFSYTLLPNRIFNDDNIVSFGLNIRGHEYSNDNINPGFDKFLTYQIGDKEQYIYRGAYMDCVRAIDFMFSQPNVDTTRVGVTGGSQGGALTFATAALCGKRIKAAAPSIPFLSDFPEYFKVALWPSNVWRDYGKAHPKFGVAGVLNTLSYVDIKNLAPWVTASVFMSVGLVDRTCPPRINFAAYNRLKTEKKYVIYPESDHQLPNKSSLPIDQFLKEQLGISSTR